MLPPRRRSAGSKPFGLRDPESIDELGRLRIEQLKRLYAAIKCSEPATACRPRRCTGFVRSRVAAFVSGP